MKFSKRSAIKDVFTWCEMNQSCWAYKTIIASLGEEQWSSLHFNINFGIVARFVGSAGNPVWCGVHDSKIHEAEQLGGKPQRVECLVHSGGGWPGSNLSRCAMSSGREEGNAKAVFFLFFFWCVVLSFVVTDLVHRRRRHQYRRSRACHHPRELQHKRTTMRLRNCCRKVVHTMHEFAIREQTALQ